MPDSAKDEGSVAPEFKDAVAFRVSSSGNAEAVLGEAISLSKGDDFVILLKGAVDTKRLLPSYVSAAIRKSEGSTHSKSLSIEIMLFLAGTMNIGNAVKKVGASGKGNMIAFASSEKLAKSLISKFNMKNAGRCSLSMDPKVTNEVALTAIREDK